MYLAVLIACTYGLIWKHEPIVVFSITTALGLSFIFCAKGAQRVRPLVYVMAVAAFIAVLLNDRSIMDVAVDALPFTLTVLLVISVSLLSLLVDGQAILGLLGRAAAGFRDRRKPSLVMCSVAVTSPFLNMATPVIYGHAFSGQAACDVQTAAVNIKRGIMVAMLMAPTFAPIAMVIGSHPDVRWESTLVYTLPLAIPTLLYFVLSETSTLSFPSERATVSGGRSGVGWVLVYMLLLLVIVDTFGLNMVGAIILASEAAVVMALLLNGVLKTGLTLCKVEERCRQATKRLRNEGLIFIASGFLLVSAVHLIGEDSVVYTIISSLPAYLVVPIVVLFLPLLSLGNVHPIIGFTIVQPMVYLNPDLLAVQKYLLWVCYWVVSLQISPISVINLTTSQAFGVEVSDLTDSVSIKKVYLLATFYSMMIIFYGVM